MKREGFDRELASLPLELVKLQDWIKAKPEVVVVFARRSAAGKGGTIKRITEPSNLRAS